MEERLHESEDNDTRDLKGKVWEESKKIWRVAFPAMLSRVLQYGMYLVTQAFIGQIGKEELAAYALAQIILVRFVHGILMGMASATETLCGQAYGARQYHMMGIYLQRSWIINIATATILLPLFFFSTQIFKLLGESDNVAAKAGYISIWFIPVIYFLLLNMTMQQFLQAQQKNMIVGWLSAISFAVHVLLSWIFVAKLNLGVPGAMGAMAISGWLIILGEFAYVFGGSCPDTWRGFRFAAFQDLLPVVKLSVSSGVMLCLEVWYLAILVLLAGYMKDATIAVSAFSICVNIAVWELMIVLGFFNAASVRVANELGGGNVEAAKFSIIVNFSTSLSIGAAFWIICLVFGRKIAYIFTSEEDVADYASSLSVLLAFSVLLNSIQSVLSGIAVGAGRQSRVAYVNLGSYYVIGVPVGALLGYVAHMQVKGIWIGMILGMTIQSLALAYITSTTNWDEQVDIASKRLKRWLLRPSEDSNGRSTREGNSESRNGHPANPKIVEFDRIQGRIKNVIIDPDQVLKASTQEKLQSRELDSCQASLADIIVIFHELEGQNRPTIRSFFSQASLGETTPKFVDFDGIHGRMKNVTIDPDLVFKKLSPIDTDMNISVLSGTNLNY